MALTKYQIEIAIKEYERKLEYQKELRETKDRKLYMKQYYIRNKGRYMKDRK